MIPRLRLDLIFPVNLRRLFLVILSAAKDLTTVLLGRMRFFGLRPQNDMPFSPWGRISRLCVACLAVLAAACTLPLTDRPEVAAYDFGPVPAAKEGGTRLRQSVLVYDVSGPAWMDTSSIHYRLSYRDASRPQAYAGSRWVMPPAALFSTRLRQRLADTGGGVIQPTDGLRAPAALRVELDEFSQVFDAENRSRGVVRLRASLMGPRALIAQKSFSVERPADSQDAVGGVRALTAASDDALEQVVVWVAASLKD